MRLYCRLKQLPGLLKLILGVFLLLIGVPVFLTPVPLGVFVLLAGILLILSALRQEDALAKVIRRRIPWLYRLWKSTSRSCSSPSDTHPTEKP